MRKQRYQVKSDCPECGCGLIHHMTPDDFRAKYGDVTDKATANFSKDGEEHDGCVIEKHRAVPNKAKP